MSFLLNQTGHSDPYKDHHTIGVSCFDYKCLKNKNGKNKAIQEQELKEHEQNSLCSHYLFGVDLGLGEALILLNLCLVLIALALVLNVKSENLDSLKCGGWGYL